MIARGNCCVMSSQCTISSCTCSFWEGVRKKSVDLSNVAFDVAFGATKAHNC